MNKQVGRTVIYLFAKTSRQHHIYFMFLQLPAWKTTTRTILKFWGTDKNTLYDNDRILSG